MHFIASCLVFLAASQLAVAFRCSITFKLFGFCGEKMTQKGGNGDWYLSTLQDQGHYTYQECTHGSTPICGTYDLFKKVLNQQTFPDNDRYFRQNTDFNVEP
ncbi:hypothetical protein PGT21_015124 [Puccinia graminis f. sp. tritici]|uniref:Secreted protein n=2 Tax=Puccinia graminis f. sp. tritici TaxID=56615 RepID=A0A5B0M1R3_PUCGR|nr:hypothetical protein PGT21_015124 [Puccinia graminis f. sp. tritici]